MILADGRVSYGKWSINGDILTITGANGYAVSRKILTVNNRVMVFEAISGTTNIKEVFEQYHLNRL